MSDVLETVELSKRFHRTLVLDGLNMNVPEGSIYGLIGPNGAGKSTTIKILMNIYEPSGGRARILGHDSRRISPEDLSRIGYVSENQELPGWMTVEYFLSYLKPFYPSWDDALADELVKQFDLPKGRRLRHLSHGMRMKAALASSLAYRPSLIVLDEPFTGLDPLVRDELIEALLGNVDGATVFISSHDLGEIESFASHIGYLDRGRLQFSEEMASLTQRFRSVEVMLADAEAARSTWPASWMNLERGPGLVRFIETKFEDERTMTEIDRMFGETRQRTVHAMPLREIFVALARARRKAA